MLLAEAMLLSTLVDARSLVDRGGGWSVLRSAGTVLTVLVAVLGAGVVLRQSLLHAWAEAASLTQSTRRGHWVAALHSGVYAALVVLSLALFRTESPSLPSAWLAWSWTVALFATVASAVEATVTWRLAVVFARRGWGSILWIALVGAVAWGAGQASQWAWQGLAGVTLDSAGSLLQTSQSEIVYRPDQRVLGTPAFAIEVAPICSGVEGMGLVLVFTSVFLLATRRQLKFPLALLLIPLGALLAWGANVLRIWALIEIGSRVSPSIALGGFHSKAGWVFFGAIALGLCLLTTRWRAFSRSAPERTETSDNPTAWYLSPLFALLFTALVTGAFTAVFDTWYGVRVVVVGGTLMVVARRFRPLRLCFDGWALALGTLVYLVWVATDRAPDSEQTAAWITALDSLPPIARSSWIALRVVGAVVTVPLAEEIAFRGYLLPRLISRDFTRVSPQRLTVTSLVVSSLLFGLLHDRWMVGTLAGVAYGWSRSRKGRLGDAVLAHAVTNALIAIHVLVAGRWQLWM